MKDDRIGHRPRECTSGTGGVQRLSRVRPVPRNLRLVTAAASTIAALGLAFGPAPASGVVPTKRCGTISVKGKRYSARAHIVSCPFAKRWASRYLATRRRPSGWRCRRYNPRETKIAFVCRRRGTDYYAVRR
jgi:hypothetical protein